jgi:hypothetical protein
MDSFGVREILASYISVLNRGGQLKIAHLAGKFSMYIIVETPRDFLYTSVERALDDFQGRTVTARRWWQFWKL